MTEAQARVIRAAREVVASPSCATINNLEDCLDALDREERASDVCPNCGRGICLCSVNETHVNTRGCDPLDADAKKAIFDSAALLKAAYERKGGE